MKRIGGSEGYLLVDHRDSPGVPDAMIAAAAAAGHPVLNTGKGLFEAGTYRCCHCHGIVLKSPRKTEHHRHKCLKCYRFTCGRAGCVLECSPMRKILDQAAEIAAKGGIVITG